ncbi:restriction endonuclease [Nocardia sp. NPDC004711]
MKYIDNAAAAEANAAVQMRLLGYPDAAVTDPGADGGIDVRAKGAIAQVKWRTGQVSRPEVQRLFGARANNFDTQMFFFAASAFSRHSVQYADSVYMALFTYDPTGRVTPINDTAKRITVNARNRAHAAQEREAARSAQARHAQEKASRAATTDDDPAGTAPTVAEIRCPACTVRNNINGYGRRRCGRCRAEFTVTRTIAGDVQVQLHPRQPTVELSKTRQFMNDANYWLNRPRPSRDTDPELVSQRDAVLMTLVYGLLTLLFALGAVVVPFASSVQSVADRLVGAAVAVALSAVCAACTRWHFRKSTQSPAVGGQPDEP